MHGGHPTPDTSTWSNSGGRVASKVAVPLQRFMHLEIAAGVMLALATAVALIWVNSPWGDSYSAFWSSHVDLGIGSFQLTHHGHHLSLHAFVNDALMTLFFFVVGLEIKRELTTGHLVDRRAAAVPAIAAIGGMVVPAALYFIVAGPAGFGEGWGIPMATDIAFALGVLSLVSKRVPSTLKIFLLTLAVVDDLGAIAVIAIFYSAGVSFIWLGAAVISMLTMALTKSAGIRYTPVYVAQGIAMWYFLLQSGVHATIAGVFCGLLAPAAAWSPRTGESLQIATDAESSRHVRLAAREAVPVTERLETLLHPVTAFIVLPLFALANAGVALSGSAISDAASSAVTGGVILGLVAGKFIGVTLFALAAVKFKIGPAPQGCTSMHIAGVAAISGIGFTVSMFVAELGFSDHHVVELAKVGILAASALAALIGITILMAARPAQNDIK